MQSQTKREAYQKAYNQKNRERIQEVKRLYQLKNKKQICSYQHRWYRKRHPLKKQRNICICCEKSFLTKTRNNEKFCGLRCMGRLHRRRNCDCKKNLENKTRPLTYWSDRSFFGVGLRKCKKCGIDIRTRKWLCLNCNRESRWLNNQMSRLGLNETLAKNVGVFEMVSRLLKTRAKIKKCLKSMNYRR